jgi:hypothetical protein
MAALLALKDITTFDKRKLMTSTFGTSKALRPAKLIQIILASAFVGKSFAKFFEIDFFGMRHSKSPFRFLSMA